MKIVALVCLFFAFAYAEYVIKTHENYTQYRDECVEELQIAESLLEEYKKMEYPDDATTHCYMKCVLNKYELFDDETGYQAENVLMQLVGTNSTDDPDVLLHGKLEYCLDKNEQGSTACEWAYRGAMCLSKNELQLLQETAAEEKTEATNLTANSN